MNFLILMLSRANLSRTKRILTRLRVILIECCDDFVVVTGEFESMVATDG